MSNPKIQSLSLKQFTAFEEAKFDFSPSINVLIGENATGKSHVMKILYTMLISVCRHQVFFITQTR
jgi:recombinational DNA repair ATPase RecF